MKKRTSFLTEFLDHPLWLAGFRPLFTLAMIAGTALPLLWVYFYLSGSPLEAMKIPVIYWHAHEMFFGFGGAVIGGFLLTASKNWVKIRGIHGWGLILVTFFWILERALLPVVQPNSVSGVIVANLFIVPVISYLVWTLVKYRKQDFFHDNYLFIISLPFFIVGKNLMLHPSSVAIGVDMTIALFRLTFAIMFERTIVQYMKNSMQETLPRIKILDSAIKHGLLLAILTPFAPQEWDSLLLGLLALLMFGRFVVWKPHVGFRRFDIAVSYAGYLGLTIHLFLKAVQPLGMALEVGTIATHVFTFFCMGLVIPGLFIRICQGHTGRKIVFTRSDRSAILIMAVGGIFRTVIPQFFPAQYTTWVAIAGSCWSASFLILGLRLIPFLWKKRIDGKEH